MHTVTLKAVAAALLTAGFGITAVAQTSPAPGTGAAPRAAQAKPSLASSDRRFMEEAARGGMAEVEMGKLAAQKAQSPDVKQFGERMVQDHTKANQQLMQIAQSKGMTPPAELDGRHKRLIDKLSKMEPAKFDREYMEEMTDDHKKDVKAFREASKDAKDPDVKSFAATTLPVLEEHLKMAESIQAKVKDMDRAARSGARSGATGSSAPGAGTGGTR
jgi:putative membrane protein